jgi:hypothetical protein
VRLPAPAANWSQEWASQNNSIIEREWRRLASQFGTTPTSSSGAPLYFRRDDMIADEGDVAITLAAVPYVDAVSTAQVFMEGALLPLSSYVASMEGRLLALGSPAFGGEQFVVTYWTEQEAPGVTLLEGSPVSIVGTFPTTVATGATVNWTLPIVGGTGAYHDLAVSVGAKPPWMTLAISSEAGSPVVRATGTADDVGATYTFSMTLRDSVTTLTGASVGQSVQVTGTAVTPADYSPALWLNDTSTVTDVSGNASQWNDISGNARHFTQGTAGNRPLIVASGRNGLRTIRFDGTDDRMRNNSTGMRDAYKNAGAAWTIGVYRKNANDGVDTTRVLLGNDSGTAGGSRFVPLISRQLNRPSMFARRLDADSTAILDAVTGNGDNWQIVVWQMVWTDGDGFIHVNGAQDVQNLSLTSSGSTSNTTAVRDFVLGAFPGATAGTDANFADVELAELATAAGNIGATAIRKLEGYAAHKWNLATLLPSGHPYKLGPPVKP